MLTKLEYEWACSVAGYELTMEEAEELVSEYNDYLDEFNEYEMSREY